MWSFRGLSALFHILYVLSPTVAAQDTAVCYPRLTAVFTDNSSPTSSPFSASSTSTTSPISAPSAGANTNTSIPNSSNIVIIIASPGSTTDSTSPLSGPVPGLNSAPGTVSLLTTLSSTIFNVSATSSSMASSISGLRSSGTAPPTIANVPSSWTTFHSLIIFHSSMDQPYDSSGSALALSSVIALATSSQTLLSSSSTSPTQSVLATTTSAVTLTSSRSTGNTFPAASSSSKFRPFSYTSFTSSNTIASSLSSSPSSIVASNSTSFFVSSSTSTSSSLSATTTSFSIPSFTSSTTASSSSTSSLTSSSSSTTSTTYCIAPTPIIRNIGRRGLPFANNSFTNFYGGHNSLVNWGYNYASIPNPGCGLNALNPAIRYIPMLFNDSPGATSSFAANVNTSIANYGTDSILSFNEPDICGDGSACMTVNQSVTAYRAFIQPFSGIVSLGAPAVTNSGASGASLTYLSWFLGNCTGCTVDFVPIHWYSNPYAFDYFQSFVQEAYVAGGNRTLWITEFGMDPDSNNGNEEIVQQFMKTAVSWLDSLSYVRRYAWFGGYQMSLNDIDGTGQEVNFGGTALSAEGIIFNNYTANYVNCTQSGYQFC